MRGRLIGIAASLFIIMTFLPVYASTITNKLGETDAEAGLESAIAGSTGLEIIHIASSNTGVTGDAEDDGNSEEAVSSPYHFAINPDPSAKTLYASVSTKSGTLNLRQKAESKSKVLAKLASGAVVRVIAIITETESQWTQVIYKDNIGYVMTKYLKFITELPYTPLLSGEKSAEILAFKQALRRLGYIKSDDVNSKYDAPMEIALTKMQLMNKLPLNPTVVTADAQALVEWGLICKYRSGYLQSITDAASGLSASIFVWDVSGTLYDADEAVNVKLSYGAQAAGGQPPYNISVRKSLSADGAAYAEMVSDPFYQMWTKSIDRLYVYATVTDAAGHTVTVCAPYKYTLPPQYDGRYGVLAPWLRLRLAG
ncbi:MAG: SH3 domain-containing protein [Oscillospiraceae bacterium]|nr:SH3 domain-containing protein [Oscillospiraceae bacterium]